MIVALVPSDSSNELAEALYADWLVMPADSMLRLDSLEVWAGVMWRIGDAARRLLFEPQPFSAQKALKLGIVDSLVPVGEDPVEWIGAWKRGRSELALDSAAMLIRRRGGDALEAAEFARLFAAGEPQIGLDAFLARRRPEWSGDR